MTNPLADMDKTTRQTLRTQLRQQHRQWALQPTAPEHQRALSEHLQELLEALEPECLGVYWPMPGEVDAREAGMAWLHSAAPGSGLALPWAEQGNGHMTFRQWDGQTPSSKDGCGIPSPDTREVVPDVLVVPCVGITRSGLRLGHGGGYYDRYLAAHPHITAIGVAWSHAVLADSALAAQAHDQPMMLVVTPDGVLPPA
jgi:5,10-methenyltetrahydrofolate synthetase